MTQCDTKESCNKQKGMIHFKTSTLSVCLKSLNCLKYVVRGAHIIQPNPEHLASLAQCRTRRSVAVHCVNL